MVLEVDIFAAMSAAVGCGEGFVGGCWGLIAAGAGVFPGHGVLGEVSRSGVLMGELGESLGSLKVTVLIGVVAVILWPCSKTDTGIRLKMIKIRAC